MLKVFSLNGNRRFNDSFKNLKQGELMINSEPALPAGRQHACAERSRSMTVKKTIKIDT